jgi:hypothetical protein
MKDKISIFKIIVNIICLALAGVIVLVFISLGDFNDIKTAVPLAIACMVFLGGVPAIMSTGNKMVKKQDEAISTQVYFNQPKSFNKRSVIFGYVLMFLPLYVFLFAVILIPHGIYVAFFLPISVMIIIISRMKRSMLESFNMSKRKYSLVQALVFVLTIAVAFIVRNQIILPLAEKYM